MPPGAEIAAELLASLRARHVGHDSEVELLVAALIAGGHVLIEGAPGLGKTRLVHALAALLGLEYRRIQCTPDLMPADITGSEVLDPESGARVFRFLPGPVFTQVLLADEINRATPRTQSALLEAMEEGQVSAGGEIHPLPQPFFVAATQNPIELEGTYPLPEAQLDRFLFKLELGRPTPAEIEAILALETPAESTPLLDAAELLALRRRAAALPLPADAASQVAAIVAATHPEDEDAAPEVREYVRYGASPRAALAAVSGGRALALLRGRMHVSPADLRDALTAALRHRLVYRYQAEDPPVGLARRLAERLR